MESSLDVPELQVIEPFNDLFSGASDYCTNRLIKWSVEHNDDVDNELHYKTKKNSV